MTAKEKALELICKYEAVTCPNWEQGNNKYTKQCAIIAVDEILQHLLSSEVCFKNHIEPTGNFKYWQEVKKELELL